MKKTAALLVVALIVAVGVWLFLSQSRTAEPAPTPAPPSATTPPAGEPADQSAARMPATHTVSMDATGFSPSVLTVQVGDTVLFLNHDARQRWPASGIHPTHLLCQGFDALRPLEPGETYSHTFTAAKECPMHDHLVPSLKGKITVTD